jgi:hypothetical protein
MDVLLPVVCEILQACLFPVVATVEVFFVVGLHASFADFTYSFPSVALDALCRQTTSEHPDNIRIYSKC